MIPSGVCPVRLTQAHAKDSSSHENGISNGLDLEY